MEWINKLGLEINAVTYHERYSEQDRLDMLDIGVKEKKKIKSKPLKDNVIPLVTE